MVDKYTLYAICRCMACVVPREWEIGLSVQKHRNGSVETFYTLFLQVVPLELLEEIMYRMLLHFSVESCCKMTTHICFSSKPARVNWWYYRKVLWSCGYHSNSDFRYGFNVSKKNTDNSETKCWNSKSLDLVFRHLCKKCCTTFKVLVVNIIMTKILLVFANYQWFLYKALVPYWLNIASVIVVIITLDNGFSAGKWQVLTDCQRIYFITY